MLLCAACSTPVVTPTATPVQRSSVLPATIVPTPVPSHVVMPIAVPTTVPASPTPATRPLLIWAVTTEAQREPVVKLLEASVRLARINAQVVAKTPDALSADLVAGTLAGLDPPDLIWGGSDDLFTLHEAGVLQPALDGLDERDFLPATIIGAGADSQRWGTPIAARGYLLLLYNRKLVSNVPQTTDNLLLQARLLNGGSRIGLVAGWVEMRWFEAWLHGVGGSSLNTNGTPNLDSAESIAALGLLKALRTAGPPPPSTYAEGAKLFRDGKAAFAIDGEWALTSYRSYSETLDLGYVALPIVSSAGKPAIAPLEGVYIMYAKQLQAAQRSAALKLVNMLLQPTSQQRIASELGYLPALRSELTSSVIRNDAALSAAASNALEAPGIAPTMAQRCVWEAGEVLLPPLLLGEATAEQVAQRLQERAMACTS
jgi:arabinogalactan oligomer / maltooligosaccharide transport system substrate-binding protein